MLLSPSGVIPIGNSVFVASLATQFNTTLTGTVSYLWFFDGASEPTIASQPSLSYSVPRPGILSLRLQASNNFTAATLNTDLTILGKFEAYEVS